MRVLNTLKQRTALSVETLNYINRYQRIYNRVILEAKKRHNDKYLENASNPNKTIWQIINKKSGKLGKGQEIWLQSDDRKITHPQEVADTLNSYFIDKVEELIEKSRSKDKVISLKNSDQKSKFNVFLANFGRRNSHRSTKIKGQNHNGKRRNP
jgi:hypothetical protein